MHIALYCAGNGYDIFDLQETKGRKQVRRPWRRASMRVRWIREKNRKRRRMLAEADVDMRMFHSASYHRHFEEYTEYRTIQPDGRTRLVRAYTGKWYRQKVSSGQYVMLRAGDLFCYLLMLLCFNMAAKTSGAAGVSGCAAVAGCISVLLLSALAYVLLVNYIFAPRRMTVGDYKSGSGALKALSAAMTVSFLLDAFVVLLYGMLHWDVGLETASMLRYLLCAGLAFSIFVMERKVIYEEQ